MPTYEYRCDTCAKNFDVVQSFTDDPLSECPTCGSPVRKVFGSVGIVFKGSGFYKTDSRSGSSASAPGESTVPAAKSDSGSSDSGSSDTGASDSGSSDTGSTDYGGGQSYEAPVEAPVESAPVEAPVETGDGG